MAADYASSTSALVTVRPQSGWRAVWRYLAVRVLVLAATVVSAVYLTIVIANLGGYVDEVIQTQIDFSLAMQVQAGWLRDTPADERAAIIEATSAAMAEAAGLNQPFVLRSLRWLWDGLTLDWDQVSRSRNQADAVRPIILDHLGRTALVFGSANLVLFGLTIGLALFLTRRYHGWLDRVFIFLSPLSAAPAWVYGVVLSVLFLRLFSFSPGGTFDAWPDEFNLTYTWIVLKHLFLPFLAIVLSGLFQGVYAWRAFFLIYANEDYVEMAKAKGLSPGLVARRYVLRPALPALLTSLALMTMTLWQEVIALEMFFNVSGIGRLFIAALRAYNTPMIVGLVVTFAYLLAVTVLALDIVYVVADPRVRVGNERQTQSRPTETLWQRWRPGRLTAGRSWLRLEAWLVWLRQRPVDLGRALGNFVGGVGNIGRQLWQYPLAVAGLLIITGLVALSIYTLATIPYAQAVSMWRSEGQVWRTNPRDALPTWVNLFRRQKLPPTFILNDQTAGLTYSETQITDEMREAIWSYPVAYPYGGLPQDVVVNFSARYTEKAPHISLTWLTPDGRTLELATFSILRTQSYLVSQDTRLQRRWQTPFPHEVLFVAPAEATAEAEATALQGDYQLQVSALLFEPEAAVETEVVIYGQVHGLAGTDGTRRDLMLAVMWGAPVALAFGLAAAIATSLGGLFLAAMGAWFGGWADRAIQFLTEVNLILPFFPVSLMIYTLYSKNFGAILGVTVALTLFGSGIKTYRAAFLQVKESPYVEAARAYGAGNGRIVSRYLAPRLVATLIPRMVILVPGYVFLEATLAFLGVSDPVLPTWGKLTAAALSYGIQRGNYNLLMASLTPLALTGFAFAMLGLALERIFEPRLRDR